MLENGNYLKHLLRIIENTSKSIHVVVFHKLFDEILVRLFYFNTVLQCSYSNVGSCEHGIE